MKKLVLTLCFLMLVAFAFAACDSTVPNITGAEINEEGDLVLTYSDGSIQKVNDFEAGISDNPTIPNITGAEINEDGDLVLTYSDGSTQKVDDFKAGTPDNPTVPNITGAEINEDGDLVLTYSDGSEQKVNDFKTDSKTVVAVHTDKNMHIILEYSDGTTSDMGLLNLQKITVIFKDYDGTILATEETYAGLGVKAPANPEREDYVFAGWDKDYTSITADTVITATYTAKQSYTVTFKDYDGRVLKTETVVSGKNATPPANPSRADYNFTGWSGNYTNVTANVTVTATYAQKGSYVVTFVDYNGLTIGTATVKEGGTATAPVTPTREGYTFRGWSSSLSNIKSNKTVTAQYTLISAANVFDISYKVSGNTVTVILSLAGDVRLAGFEGTLAFTGMTATAVTGNSANVLANLKDGVVSFAYTSATNVTKGETVLTVTLTKTADNGTADLTLAQCFNQNFEDVSYKIIGENLKLK